MVSLAMIMRKTSSPARASRRRVCQTIANGGVSVFQLVGESRKTTMNSKLADTQTTDNIREQFHSLLTRANKERPSAADIQALKDLLYDNKELELWKAIVGMGELAESQVLDTIVNGSGQGMRECWRQRLIAMRAELGYAEASALERLLIQQVTLCWLNLNLTEYRFTNVTKQSISFASGLYWEKRLSAAQRRFTRACETLARVRKLSRNTPALQFNIATSGGQQVNLTK